jgi:hypothetical protein
MKTGGEMKLLNRRELCVALSALAAMVQPAAVAQSDSAAKKETVLSRQMTFAFDQMPASTSNFGVTREVLKGVLPTGEYVGLHETTLMPGFMPHPDHKQARKNQTVLSG